MSSGLYNQRIDARGSEPLYVQVMQRLRAELADGRLQVGQRLAPERELCARFGVSRNTLRRALLDLEEQGLLAAAGRRRLVRGRGSPLVELAQGPHSLTEWAHEAGVVLTSRVAAPAAAGRVGGRGGGARRRGGAVFELERLRIVDGLALLARPLLPAGRAGAGAGGASTSRPRRCTTRWRSARGWCRANATACSGGDGRRSHRPAARRPGGRAAAARARDGGRPARRAARVRPAGEPRRSLALPDDAPRAGGHGVRATVRDARR